MTTTAAPAWRRLSALAAGAARWWRARTPGRRDALWLAALGILSRALIAALERQPGYIDGAYYYAVARNVAQGRGLTEDFIITYLA
ncbi:MAG TPA: hypothetical protein VIG30_15085, partial [Ktedonobacterales bacterium]